MRELLYSQNSFTTVWTKALKKKPHWLQSQEQVTTDNAIYQLLQLKKSQALPTQLVNYRRSNPSDSKHLHTLL